VLFWIAWAALVLVLIAATYFAWYLVRTVRAFNSIDIVETIRGPKPKRARTIQKRIDRAKAFANSTLLSLSRQASLLIFSGIVVPGAVMASIAVHQDWLLPGPPALIADGAESAVEVVSSADIAIFISDQALRGALSDTFEVFDLSLSRVTNNPDNTIFSGLVLFYRLLSALGAAALVYVFISVVRARPHMREYIRDLERQLEDSSKSSSANSNSALHSKSIVPVSASFR
tara:strand:+ start:206 stop:895 length:690 start_codon:yes stop_codon:yes gene_type:complete